MAEGLTTATGQKLGTDPAGAPDTSAFDAAIQAAATDKVLPEHQPPKRTRPAPTPDEAKAARKTAAKTPREARPRTTPAAVSLPARDYTADLDALGEGVWVALTSVPPTAGYAVILNAGNRAPMVNAWNAAAQQSPAVRGWVDQLAGGGGGTWVLGVAIATLPAAMITWQLVTDKTLREQVAEANRAELTAWAQAKGLLKPAEQSVPEAA